jgi:hypothetical protein
MSLPLLVRRPYAIPPFLRWPWLVKELLYFGTPQLTEISSSSP